MLLQGQLTGSSATGRTVPLKGCRLPRPQLPACRRGNRLQLQGRLTGSTAGGRTVRVVAAPGSRDRANMAITSMDTSLKVCFIAAVV
jgi:hypothetical protein